MGVADSETLTDFSQLPERLQLRDGVPVSVGDNEGKWLPDMDRLPAGSCEEQ